MKSTKSSKGSFSEKINPEIFITTCFYRNISKSDAESQNLECCCHYSTLKVTEVSFEHIHPYANPLLISYPRT